MSKQNYQLKTERNYLLSEVRSALQKAIRRGELENSMYWACELHDSGFEKYLLYSLSTIAAEDIGHYNPALYSAINSTLNLWYSIFLDRKKAKQRTEIRPAIGSIVVMMVTSKKTRIADDAYMSVAIAREQGVFLDIPDSAVDEHTARGKDLQRSSRFWVRQASKIHPRASSKELGVKTDYSSELDAYYLENSEIEDECDYSEWNPNFPNESIYKFPYNYREDKDEEK
jgi:replication-associated recombination protein RarA